MSERTSLEEAANLMLRLQESRANSETFLEWQRWLAAAPEHRAAYEQIERTMSRLADLESTPMLPPAVEMAADTYDGSISVSEYLEGSRPGVHRSSAQSSLCDSGANYSHCTSRPSAYLTAVGGKRRHAPLIRYAMAACVTAALVVVGWMGYASLDGMWGNATQQTILAYATAPAQRKTVALPDGSSIILDADSAITIELGPNERMLRLTRGEAYFQVAKDAKRPFIVSAGGARARAVGTEFNVRTGAQRTVVAVVEGIVQVSAPSYLEEGVGDSRMAGIDRHREESQILVMAELGAGQAVAYEGEKGLRALPATDASLATTWLDGRRQYLNEALQYVLMDVDRYTGRRVEVADAETGALKFTGTLSLENSDAWLKALTIALPVKIVQQANGKLLVSLKESDAGAVSERRPDSPIKDNPIHVDAPGTVRM